MSYRMERIERLLNELEYEIVRGMMDREIDETIHFRFIVPVSQRIRDGMVKCEFHTRPVHRGDVWMDTQPKLKLVKTNDPP